MNTQENIPWEKLAQYFAGELAGEEHRNMDNWINADPARAKQIEQLYQLWVQSGELPYNLDANQSWNRLSSSMDEVDAVRQQPIAAGSKKLYKLPVPRQVRRSGVATRRAVIAAAVALVMVTAGYFAMYYQASPQDGITEAENRVITTRDGERASYLLSDGSRVVLHAGSRLEIPENYNEENRELYLEGEAYFETAHNPEKPFIVHSGDSYTRVVGTEFLVQAWPGADDQRIEVVVSEGQVLFGSSRDGASGESSNEVLLSQNQRGQLAAGSTTPVVDEIEDLGWHLGWTEGRLVFENRELREVLPRLERWYDISIEVANDAIAAKKITAEIDYSLPMKDVLQGMALSLDLEVERSCDRGYRFWQEK